MTQELRTAWSSMKDKSASFKAISRGGWTEGGSKDSKYREWIQELWWQSSVREWYNLMIVRVWFFLMFYKGKVCWPECFIEKEKNLVKKEQNMIKDRTGNW